MAANLILFLICITTLITPTCLDGVLHPSILKILSAFINVINFYGENYHDINIDGIFGLKVLEGHLKELVKLHQEKGHSSNIPNDIINHLLTLSDEAAVIANLSIPYLEGKDKSYFRSMGRIVSQPWTVFKNYRNIDIEKYKWETLDTFTWPDYGEKINWEKSDSCLSSVLSLDVDDNEKCEMTDECLEMLLTREVHSYRLTHQVFFLMMMEELGCKDTIEDYLKRQHRPLKLEDIETDFCTNCYYDLLSIEKVLNVDFNTQTLFLVNKFYCGSLGFVQFMKDEWLDLVLKWQNPSGCFTNSFVEDNVSRKKDKISRKKEDYLRPDNLPQSVKQENIVPQRQNSKKIIRPHKNNIKQNKQINQNSIQAEENINVQNNNKNSNNQNIEEIYTDENSAYMDSPPRHRREAIINLIEDYKIERTLTRKLLKEQEIKGGCFTHKTAMAVGTLTMYLRYLIDPPTKYSIGEGRQKNDYFKPDEIAEQLSKSPIKVAVKTTVKPKLQTSPPAKNFIPSILSYNDELFTGSSILSFKNSANTTIILTVVIVFGIILFFLIIKCMRRRTYGSRGKHW